MEVILNDHPYMKTINPNELNLYKVKLYLVPNQFYSKIIFCYSKDKLIKIIKVSYWADSFDLFIIFQFILLTKIIMSFLNDKQFVSYPSYPGV
jgi:hypothetical protein